MRFLAFFLFILLLGCSTNEQQLNTTSAQNPPPAENEPSGEADPNPAPPEEVRTNYPLPLILDTDANNEIDDQHAIAYVALNPQTFNLLGVTVNATENGGEIDQHIAEAERVLHLVNRSPAELVYSGANGNFAEIQPQLNQDEFDGQAAVNFIVETARKYRDHELVILPIGKLTNIALALAQAPDIADNIRIVWLGSNYPSSGEYNLENDVDAMNYLLDHEVPFELVTVRYDAETGSAAVRFTPERMQTNLAGAGPEVSPPVTGRHGGSFTHFGDYALNLFERCELYGDPPGRSLFDVVAAAVLKEPNWGGTYDIGAPVYQNGQWIDRPENERLVTVWENFDREAILEDFFATMKNTDSQDIDDQ